MKNRCVCRTKKEKKEKKSKKFPAAAEFMLLDFPGGVVLFSGSIFFIGIVLCKEFDNLSAERIFRFCCGKFCFLLINNHE